MVNMITPTSSTVDSALIAALYAAVWREPDARLRRAAITDLWVHDGVEFIEGGVQFRGHEELNGRITNAYTEFVGSGKYTVAHEDVARHDNLVTLTVQLISTGDGEVAWAARVFLLLDENGLIREEYQLTVQALAA